SQIPQTAFVGGVGYVDHVDLYRTAGPMGTGKIGCIGKTGSGCLWILPDGIYNPAVGLTSGSVPVVQDTGLTADGTTPPTVNTTGSVGAPLYATATNCAVSSASPAACSSAAAGQVAVPTGAATYTVNTT